MDESRVPPPDSTSAAPDVRPPAVELRGSIRRGDVASACARASRALYARPPGAVTCGLGALENPALPVVEVLARLALQARRNRQRMRLEHAPPALLELLILCGLDRIADVAVTAGAAGVVVTPARREPGDASVDPGR